MQSEGGFQGVTTNQVWPQTGLWLQSYSSFCKRHRRTMDGRWTDDGRNLDPLVSLHLGGLDKKQAVFP